MSLDIVDSTPLCIDNPDIKARTPSSPIEFPCKWSSWTYVISNEFKNQLFLSYFYIKIMFCHTSETAE